MDINKYRKYIRDMELTDTELIDLIQTVINDIARDTLIFKDLFMFNVESCFDIYDINLLYSTAQVIRDDNITSLSITSTLNTPEDLSKYIDTINIVSVEDTICDDTSTNTKVDITSTTSNVNTYLSLNDILYIENDLNKNVRLDKRAFTSVYSSWFNIITESILNLNKNNLFNETIYTSNSVSFEIPVVCKVNIVPDLNNITDEVEYVLQKTLIEGIKYFLSDSYMNTQNTQTANILYQRYYSSKRQLKYNYANDINSFDKYRRF